MSLTRKEFLSSLVGVAAGAVGAAVLVACSDSGSSGTDASAAVGNCAANGTATPVIGGNHGHVLVVAKADITAGVAKTYDIKGTATHSHTVTLSAANFTALTSNTVVMTVSSTDGHNHTITVMCA